MLRMSIFRVRLFKGCGPSVHSFSDFTIECFDARSNETLCREWNYSGLYRDAEYTQRFCRR